MSAGQVHLVADASRRSTSSGGSARAAPELDAAQGGLGGGKAQRKDTPSLQARWRAALLHACAMPQGGRLPCMRPPPSLVPRRRPQVRQRPLLATGAALQWQQLTALCRKNLTIRCAVRLAVWLAVCGWDGHGRAGAGGSALPDCRARPGCLAPPALRPG